jgi:hypothetical protein
MLWLSNQTPVHIELLCLTAGCRALEITKVLIFYSIPPGSALSSGTLQLFGNSHVRFVVSGLSLSVLTCVIVVLKRDRLINSGCCQLEAVGADQNSFGGRLSGTEDDILDAPWVPASAPAIPALVCRFRSE